MTRLPRIPWTAETSIAFLLALRLHGRVTAAAAAIGRDESTAYAWRKRDPDFAERWAAVVAELTAATEAERAAVRHEGALDEADVLDRRTRIGLVPTDRAAALDTARELLGEVLDRQD